MGRYHGVRGIGEEGVFGRDCVIQVIGCEIWDDGMLVLSMV